MKTVAHLCGCIALAFLSTDAFAAITYGDTSKLNSTSLESYGNYSPDIAASENGADIMVAYEREAKIYTRFSTDYGSSWGAEIEISSPLTGNSKPRIATNNAGIWTVVWSNSSPMDVKYKSFKKSLNTWDNIGTLETNGPTSTNPLTYYDFGDWDPSIGCSFDGYWIISFQRQGFIDGDQYGQDRDIFFSYSQGGLASNFPSFSDPQPLIAAEDQCYHDEHAVIDCAPSGAIKLFWLSNTYGDADCGPEVALRIIGATKPTATLSGTGSVVYNLHAIGGTAEDLAVRHVRTSWYAAWAGTTPSTGLDYEIFFSDLTNVSIISDNPTTDTHNDLKPSIGTGNNDWTILAWQSTAPADSSAPNGGNIVYKDKKPTFPWSSLRYVDPDATIHSGYNSQVRLSSLTNLGGPSYAVWQSTDTATSPEFDILFSTYW